MNNLDITTLEQLRAKRLKFLTAIASIQTELSEVNDAIYNKELAIREENAALVKQLRYNVAETDNGVQITTLKQTQTYVKAEIAYDWRDKYNELLKKYQSLSVAFEYAKEQVEEFFAMVKL